MDEVEKPFGCTEPNCSMSFTNEDHLQVHRRCHDMHLAVDYGQQVSLGKPPIFVIDQTPTPTQFLKHNEEVNLFQDINLNPFDEEFRRASQANNPCHLSVPEPHCSNDSLETPRIAPPVESDETISSTSKDDILLSTNASSINFHSSSLGVSSTQLVSDDTENTEHRRRLTLDVSSASENIQTSSVISTPTPVITAGPSVSQTLGTSCSTPSLNTPVILHPGSNTVTSLSLSTNSEIDLQSISPTLCLSSNSVQSPRIPQMPLDSSQRINVPLSTSSTLPSTSILPGSASVPSSPATVLQLVLRLPNGHSLPVEIPANPIVNSVSPNSSGTNGVINIAPTPAGSNFSVTATVNNTSLAKMKLKQALASSNTAAKPGNNKHSRANTANRIAEMTRNQEFTSPSAIDIQDDSNSSCSSVSSNPSYINSPTNKKRRHSHEDDPVEKRKKFLERNRVAAIRCREKKKKFIETLSAKSDELGAVNQRLQKEVSNLKSEVAALKTLLLKHKDCPITLAMKDETDKGHPTMPTSFTTFKIERPSGVITEVITTPITSTMSSNFSSPGRYTTSVPNVSASSESSLEMSPLSGASIFSPLNDNLSFINSQNETNRLNFSRNLLTRMDTDSNCSDNKHPKQRYRSHSLPSLLLSPNQSEKSNTESKSRCNSERNQNNRTFNSKHPTLPYFTDSTQTNPNVSLGTVISNAVQMPLNSKSDLHPNITPTVSVNNAKHFPSVNNSSQLMATLPSKLNIKNKIVIYQKMKMGLENK